MSKQNAYESEVRRIAELILRSSPFFDSHISFDSLQHKAKELHINNMLPAARKMVAEMAKQYEFAYFTNYDGGEDSEDYALWNQNCISEMQERGLIP